MKLQVLVAAMQQKDLSLAEKMNTRCSTVIANQADRDEVLREATAYGEVKMVTTPTRGVGLNRNIALLASDADIVLFMYRDNYYKSENDDPNVQIDEHKAECIVAKNRHGGLDSVDLYWDGQYTRFSSRDVTG